MNDFLSRGALVNSPPTHHHDPHDAIAREKILRTWKVSAFEDTCRVGWLVGTSIILRHHLFHGGGKELPSNVSVGVATLHPKWILAEAKANVAAASVFVSLGQRGHKLIKEYLPDQPSNVDSLAGRFRPWIVSQP